MRDDTLARILDRGRWRSSAVSLLPADELWRRGEPSVSGQTVADAYGMLAHYTTWDALTWIIAQGAVGPGCWLTPTAYAACMAPYDLGLITPRQVSLLIDIRAVPALWGPGTARPSGAYPATWRGGGVEFYCPTPIAFDLVQQVTELAPCGDTYP